MRTPLLLAILLVPLVGTAFADSQILSTDVGTLDVRVFPLDIPSTGDTNLNVDFINPSTDKFFQHIDYTVLITKDGQSVFETEAHTSKGTVLIPVDFPVSGIYNIDVTIQGIFFQEIPTEKVSFKVPVILKDPVRQQYTTILCHKDSPIRIDSAYIREHIAHGDTRGECKTISTPIIEEINVPTPEPEIPETPIQETVAVPQVTISNEPEKILTLQEITDFVDLIIGTMNTIFALVYELEDDPRLEQWASDVIQDRVERTQDKIYSQLETTQDISQLRAESDKILNPIETQPVVTESQITQINPQPQIITPTIAEPQIKSIVTPQPQIITPTIAEPQIKSIVTTPTLSSSGIVIEYEPIPKTADEAIVNGALSAAMSQWGRKNPDFRMEIYPQLEPDLMIKWREVELKDELGHAEIDSLNYPGVGYMEISLGNYDCNGDYVLQDRNMLTNTIMHEIGHALGLGHHPDENHLMYGDDDFTQQNFDTLGLKIPKKLEQNYIGQAELNKELVSLDKKMGENADKLEKMTKDIEYLYSLLEEEPKFDSHKRIQFRLDHLLEESEVLNAESDLLIDRYNKIFPKFNCFPNVIME